MLSPGRSPCRCSCRVKRVENHAECLRGSFRPRRVPRGMGVPGIGWRHRQRRVQGWVGSSGSAPARGWASGDPGLPRAFPCFICLRLARWSSALQGWKASALSPGAGTFPLLCSPRWKGVRGWWELCFVCRYSTLPSRRTLKNSRLVSKKDDVHVCIMCLRAIMNYQVSPFLFCWST